MKQGKKVEVSYPILFEEQFDFSDVFSLDDMENACIDGVLACHILTMKTNYQVPHPFSNYKASFVSLGQKTLDRELLCFLFFLITQVYHVIWRITEVLGMNSDYS